MLSRAGKAMTMTARSNAVVSVQRRGMGYAPTVIEHYESPKNVGSLDKSAKNVGTGAFSAGEGGSVRGTRELTPTTKAWWAPPRAAT